MLFDGRARITYFYFDKAMLGDAMLGLIWILCGFVIGACLYRLISYNILVSLQNIFILWSFLIGFTLIVLFLSIASYFEIYFSEMHHVLQYMSNYRFYYVFIGVVSGYFYLFKRSFVIRTAASAGAALISGTSWVLQAAVAILILGWIIYLYNPNLLTKIESFKAGDFEAKFSSNATTTREALRINLAAFSTANTISTYTHFVSTHLRGARFDVRRLEFADGKSNSELEIDAYRFGILNLLMTNYIQPFAEILGCLEFAKRDFHLRTDAGFMKLISDMRSDLIIGIKTKNDFFNEPSWSRYLNTLNEIIKRERNNAQSIAVSFSEDCDNLRQKPIKESSPSDDAKRIQDLSSKARANISKNSEVEQMSYIDPYIISVLGDLVRFAFGDSEKAEFYSRVLEGYSKPERLNLVSPGLINLFYQSAVVKFGSDVFWPLESKIFDLRQADLKIDRVIQMTGRKISEIEHLKDDSFRGIEYASKDRQLINFYAKEIDVNDDEATLSDNEKKLSDLVRLYNQINETYISLKLYVGTAYLAIYNGHVLSGDQVNAEDRQRWGVAYKYIESALNNLNNEHLVGIVRLPRNIDINKKFSADFPDRHKKAFAKAAINDAYVFDAIYNMALTTILLTESNGRSSAEACVASKSYLDDARRLAERSELYSITPAAKGRWRGVVNQIGSRIASACD